MRALVQPAFRDPACVDSLGAYLELRRHDVTTIAEALALLCGGPVTPPVFDAVADGLYLVRLEREDDAPPAPGRTPRRPSRFVRRPR